MRAQTMLLFSRKLIECTKENDMSDERAERYYFWVCLISFIVSFLSCIAVATTLPLIVGSTFWFEEQMTNLLINCNDSIIEDVRNYMKNVSSVTKIKLINTKRQAFNNALMNITPMESIAILNSGKSSVCCIPGRQGRSGTNGKNGKPGVPGKPGKPGSPGMLDADISTKMFNIRFECDNCLPGPAGEPGEAGLKGDKGMKGDVGIKGSQGSMGQCGRRGIQGRRGPQGPTGMSGDAGINILGTDAIAGDPGDFGLPGPPGVQGTRGFPAEPSVTIVGIKGEKGRRGRDGIPGTIGQHGDRGKTGRPGRDGECTRCFDKPSRISNASEKKFP